MSKNGLEFLIQTLSEYSDKWKVDISTGVWFNTNGDITTDEITIKDKYFDSRGYSNDRREALKELTENLLNRFDGDFRLLLVSKKTEQGEYGPHIEQGAMHYAKRGNQLVIDKLNFTKNAKEYIKNKNFRDLGLISIFTHENKPKYVSTLEYKRNELNKIRTLLNYKNNIKKFILNNFENTSKYDLGVL